MACEYVRQYYDVPAEIGRAVVAYGKPGVIVEDRGHHIGITLDEDEPGIVGPYHPVDGIEYGEMRGIRRPKPPSKAKQRYHDYLQSEYSGSFSEYLGVEVPRIEFSYAALGSLRRMKTSHTTGGWAPTNKAAKTLYKEALKKRAPLYG